MLIGATRCGVKCENTVLHETQGPCGSVRKRGADSVTDDTRAHVKVVTPVTLDVTLAWKNVWRSGGLGTCGGREHPKHQSADLTFQALGSFTRTKSDFLEHREHEKFKCQNPAVVPALSSTLSASWFWLYCETLFRRFHVEDNRTQRFTTFHSICQKSFSSWSTLPASRTYGSNEDHLPLIQRLPRHSRHGCPR